MKKNKSRLSKKPILLLVLLVLLLSGGFWIYRVRYQKPAPVSGDTNQSTTQQIKQQADTDAEKKKQAVENPPTPNNQNNSSSIVLSARQESNGTVTVFTKLYNVSSGTCSLLVTNGYKQTTQTAEIIYQPEYSTCAGFSVPISKLGAGNWTIKLTVTHSDQTKTNSINYEVK
ncbi:MAG TPA: hypothetical protein VLG25_02370 [Patescibacteria group bacterium]|nr:hypothetical protein [Patescibacteria group bacterium]